MSRALAFALLALTTAVAQEDRVRLKSGAEFTGRILSETGGVVRLAFPGGVVDLRPETIAEVTRAVRDPEREADAATLVALDRLPDADDWFFLYRGGVRTGWRHVRRTREIRDGVAGYQRVDRRVFTARAGGPPEVDVATTEFVDADLKARAATRRLSAGASARLTEGTIVDGRLTLTERAGGKESVRRAPWGEDTELAGFLGDRLAREPRKGGPAERVRVFDGAEGAFATQETSKSLRRTTLGGRVLDVVVLKRTADGATTEAWYDVYGRPLREELQGGALVAVRTDPEKVRRFAAGEAVGDDDLGLVVEIDAAGLKLTKPDPAWETVAGDAERSLAATLVRPGARATCDVFVLPRQGAADDDAACLDVLGQVEAGLERATTEGPDRARFGARRGVRFVVEGVRRGSAVRTLGFVTTEGDRVYVLLCAAPTSAFDEALPSFDRILSSLVIEPASKEAPGAPTSDA